MQKEETLLKDLGEIFHSQNSTSQSVHFLYNAGDLLLGHCWLKLLHGGFEADKQLSEGHFSGLGSSYGSKCIDGNGLGLSLVLEVVLHGRMIRLRIKGRENKRV